MDKEDISITDIERIFFGEAPAEFMLEVLFRTILIFLASLIFLRLIGKRMGGVLTFSELAVMLTMGAILAAPMQIPENGILQGLLVMVCILMLQRGLNLWEFKNRKVERSTQGKAILLVKDGRIANKSRLAANISRHQIFSQLRSEDVFNLGSVKRMYLEADGSFSIFKYPEPRPGLSVLPTTDTAFLRSSDKYATEHSACSNCGNVITFEPTENCVYCESMKWEKAISEI